MIRKSNITELRAISMAHGCEFFSRDAMKAFYSRVTRVVCPRGLLYVAMERFTIDGEPYTRTVVWTPRGRGTSDVYRFKADAYDDIVATSARATRGKTNARLVGELVAVLGEWRL